MDNILPKVHERVTGTTMVDGHLYTYYGINRDWNLMKGLQEAPTTSTVWEVKTVYQKADIYAGGITEQEAVDNLSNLIRRMNRHSK